MRKTMNMFTDQCVIRKRFSTSFGVFRTAWAGSEPCRSGNTVSFSQVAPRVHPHLFTPHVVIVTAMINPPGDERGVRLAKLLSLSGDFVVP